MEIVFRTYIDTTDDDYIEDYEADVIFDDGSGTITVSAGEDEMSYDEFRADLLESILDGILSGQGRSLMVYEEEPVVDDIWFEDDIFDEDDGYQIIFDFFEEEDPRE